MTAHTETCEACGQTVEGEIYHLGFSDMAALYCSSCPRVLLLKDWTLLDRNGIKSPNLMAHDPGFQPYDRHLLSYFEQIEALFRPCQCGGHYRYMNSPRCPHCNGLLRGDCYEDKPILKERDCYVFVTASSVDDHECLRANVA